MAEDIPFYCQSGEQVLARLESTPQGLTRAQAAARLEKNGPNKLPKGQQESAWSILWKQLTDPLIIVLIVSASVAVATGKATDGLTVLAVVVANAWIGMAQELRARKAIESLSGLVPSQATVLRDGRETSVQGESVTTGDIIVLQAGDKVPADARILDGRNLEMDESALTGESHPVEKSVAPLEGLVGLAERKNMAFSGCLVTRGSARAVIVAIGSATELGRINTMLHQTDSLATPLTLQLEKLAKRLTVGIVILAVLLFAVCLVRGLKLVDASLVALTLAVGAIPEGLPAIVTISLALGVRRMAARNALIRHLPVVETLGSANVICTDKTGTLTCNEMTVRQLWLADGGESISVSGTGYESEGALEPASEKARDLVRGGLLCNDADEEGDPTELALLTVACKAGLDVAAERQKHPRLDYVPFESETRYMATLHQGALYVKGAPEVVAAMCPSADTGALDAEVQRLAEGGMRVLALASRSYSESKLADGWQADFELLGLFAMIDPPHPEALKAIADCRTAGIQVKMITGDHPVTAGAIAAELGLAKSEVITGKRFHGLAEEDLRKLVLDHHVYARVEPEHKLAIVRALQKENQLTAMTGDGVNDAPALRQADIGIAMGKGSAVSQEAGDMILTDNNFASIVAAVYEGRRVYDNLIKAVAFLLPVNLSLALVLMMAILFFPQVDGSPLLPMLPTQILWINLVASVLLSLPLALEAGEGSLMKRSPRPRAEELLNRRMIWRTVAVSTLMTVGTILAFLAAYYGTPDDPRVGQSAAQTEAVNTMVLFQCFYLLQCRRLRGWGSLNVRRNPIVFAGIAAMLLLQFAFVYWPTAQSIFHTTALKRWDWFQDIIAALLIMPLVALFPLADKPAVSDDFQGKAVV